MKYILKSFGALGLLFLVVFPAITWVINIIQFFHLDFEPSYKLEILKGIGIIIPWFSMISVFF